MKFTSNRRLFWFFKDRTKLDLDTSSGLDTYVQQVLSHGNTKDVKDLLKNIKPLKFQESFNRLKRFLPKEVKAFWEDFLGSSSPSTKRNS